MYGFSPPPPSGGPETSTVSTELLAFIFLRTEMPRPIGRLKLAARSRLAALESTVTEADLIHFVNAQSDVYDQVTEELTEGRKRTHWMWFIFPQLAGLGHSGMARRYAIRDLDHAKRYLADHLLGGRLCQDVRLIMGHKRKSALDILGSPDDLKFRSCLTLFAEAASHDSDCVLFKEGLDQFYGGRADPLTMELLCSTAPGNISS
jgi:uncharacterized protein (DUF1810 family)